VTTNRLTFSLSLLVALCLTSVIGTESVRAGSANQNEWSGTTWSGTFQSQHTGASPFTMTVVINLGPDGNLVGTTSSAADCFTDATLQVTLKGSRVVLAGSDAEGNNITFRGYLDSSGTILNLNYILNSSASGRCESDDGAGNLVKR
jgi:hypothetical protein